MEIRFDTVYKKIKSGTALDVLDFFISDTGVIGLLGDYGSGKSTILSLLAGYLQPDSGNILIDQKKANLKEVRDAVKLGIGSIDPNLNLYNKFTISQNLALNPSYTAKRFDQTKKEFSALCTQLELDFEFDDLLGEYTDDVKIIFEIIRLYLFGYKLILLDEPFKYFSDEQKNKLAQVFDLIKKQNTQIIFSTQYKDEILLTCDTCIALKKGKLLGQYDKPFSQFDDLSIYSETHSTPNLSEYSDTNLLSLVDFQVTSEDEKINYNVRTGEIVGVYSAPPDASENLLMCCAGLQKAFSGEIILNGFDLFGRALQEYINDGVVYIPGDRMRGSLIPEMTLYEHLGLIGDFAIKTFSPTQVKINTKNRLTQLGLDYEINDKVKNLSKTDQVKFLFGILPSAMSLLICLLPTEGLDRETKQWVWQHLILRAKSGIGVLVFSSDVEEIQQYTHTTWLNLDGNWLEPIESKLLLTELSQSITTANGDEEKYETQ